MLSITKLITFLSFEYTPQKHSILKFKKIYDKLSVLFCLLIFNKEKNIAVKEKILDVIKNFLVFNMKIWTIKIELFNII